MVYSRTERTPYKLESPPPPPKKSEALLDLRLSSKVKMNTYVYLIAKS